MGHPGESLLLALQHISRKCFTCYVNTVNLRGVISAKCRERKHRRHHFLMICSHPPTPLDSKLSVNGARCLTGVSLFGGVTFPQPGSPSSTYSSTFSPENLSESAAFTLSDHCFGSVFNTETPHIECKIGRGEK